MTLGAFNQNLVEPIQSLLKHYTGHYRDSGCFNSSKVVTIDVSWFPQSAR